MRKAFKELLEFCPPSLDHLRANVVLLSGNVDDEFALNLGEQRTDLTGVLLKAYNAGADRILLYSLNRGLRRPKTPQLQNSDDNAGISHQSLLADPGKLIQGVMERHRTRRRQITSASDTGPFVNAPTEALREIYRTLVQSERTFLFFSYSPLLQLLGESSTDLVSILEGIPSLCRERKHLLIFSGVEPHNDLERVFPKSVQKVLRLQVGGPCKFELERTLIEEEVLQRRSLIDCDALPQVLASLEQIASRPSNGLKTIVDNFLRAPNCWLDGAWATENGDIKFDIDRIDFVRLDQELSNAIIGQDIPKQEVMDRLRRFSAFGKDGRGPFLRLMFVGPSGVGKTEIARIVCRSVFESESAMLTVACTEYSQPHEVAKLLGAPPGYSGHDQPALLESHRNKYSAGLLLLDEFEKAHPDIHRFFMNILEEGVATSPRSEGGRPVALDFTNYIVIATSNAGSEVDSGTAPKPLNARQELYDKALKTKFPPELLGRFQERLIFDFLSIEQLAKIASLHAKSQLQKFIDNCRQRGTPEPAFAVDENLYDHIAKSSDPVLGARDLRGKVEKVFQRVWMERYFEAAQKPTLVKFSVEDAVRANVNV